MDVTVAALIFGLAVLVVFAVLMWRSQDRKGGAEATLSFGKLFSATVKLDKRSIAEELTQLDAGHVEVDP